MVRLATPHAWIDSFYRIQRRHHNRYACITLRGCLNVSVALELHERFAFGEKRTSPLANQSRGREFSFGRQAARLTKLACSGRDDWIAEGLAIAVTSQLRMKAEPQRLRARYSCSIAAS